MREWSKEEIEDAMEYGIILHNVDGKPMVTDHCERCNALYTREANEVHFPRYCEKCLNPFTMENERRDKGARLIVHVVEFKREHLGPTELGIAIGEDGTIVDLDGKVVDRVWDLTHHFSKGSFTIIR